MIYSASTIGLTAIPVTIRSVVVPDDRVRSWSSGLRIADSHPQANTVRQRLAAVLDRAAAGQPRLQCPGRVTISYEPSNQTKPLDGMDLPAVLAILEAMWPDRFKVEPDSAWWGTMNLDESLGRVEGLLVAAEAWAHKHLIVPLSNQMEAGLLRQPTRLVHQLADVLSHVLTGKKLLKPVCSKGQPESPCAVDMASLLGNRKAKRAAEIAAAGGHSAMLLGSQGTGKTMLGQAFAGILPPMTVDEQYEVTRIYSACGLIPAGQLVTARPFRSVHHSISMQGLVGGGSAGRICPGEVSLAHKGVLFVDEAPEFSRNALDALRKPIESGVVHLSRVGVQTILPASFALLAAANPCRCGYSGTYWCSGCQSWSLHRICGCGGVAQERCRCSPVEARRYQAKLSGPMLDRIDLRVRMLPLSSRDRLERGESSTIVQQRGVLARERMAVRLKPFGVRTNATIPPGQTMVACRFETSGLEAYERLLASEPMSNRRADRLVRVAQTIADLDGRDITRDDVAEAASFVI